MIKIIKTNTPYYPPLLGQINEKPDTLYVRGNKEILSSQKMVGIVGSRQLDDYTKRMVEEIVGGLVEEGWAIVSGLAMGIDTLASEAAIAAGGKTIAVIPGGVGRARPKVNQPLFEKIINGRGAIVSEDREGAAVTRESFLARNRIVAGMAKGIVVISGRRRSGTLNTAAWAAKLGREVMAIPGRITDELSGAPNWLIKNGVALVESSADVLEVLIG